MNTRDILEKIKGYGKYAMGGAIANSIFNTSASCFGNALFEIGEAGYSFAETAKIAATGAAILGGIEAASFKYMKNRGYFSHKRTTLSVVIPVTAYMVNNILSSMVGYKLLNSYYSFDIPLSGLIKITAVGTSAILFFGVLKHSYDKCTKPETNELPHVMRPGIN